MEKFKIEKFVFSDIESKKFRETLPSQLNIRSTPTIISFQSVEDKRSKISFSFVIEYLPGIASMKFEGNMIVLFSSQKDLNENEKKWIEKKKLNDDLEVFVKNFLFRQCLTLGIFLAERMGLPPPIMFPQIVKRKFKIGKRRDVNLDYIG